MTLSDLARILRHSDFKDRLRHVDCDRRTIHLGSSFHRGLWTQGDFGTSMPFKSREESIPSGFGGAPEPSEDEIMPGWRLFRSQRPMGLCRAIPERWAGRHGPLPARRERPRRRLSTEILTQRTPRALSRIIWARVARDRGQRGEAGSAASVTAT